MYMARSGLGLGVCKIVRAGVGYRGDDVEGFLFFMVGRVEGRAFARNIRRG